MQNSTLVGLLVVFVLWLPLNQTTFGQVHDNGAPIIGGGPGTDVLSDARYSIQAVEDFVLARGKTTFSRILWFGTYTTFGIPAPDNFGVDR